MSHLVISLGIRVCLIRVLLWFAGPVKTLNHEQKCMLVFFFVFCFFFLLGTLIVICHDLFFYIYIYIHSNKPLQKLWNLSVSYEEHNFSSRPLATAPGTAALITEWRNTGSILLRFYLFCASYSRTFVKGNNVIRFAEQLVLHRSVSRSVYTFYSLGKMSRCLHSSNMVATNTHWCQFFCPLAI